MCPACRKEIIMAKRTANTNTQAAAPERTAINNGAAFSITGTLDSVYVGKKYAYAKVKVQKNNGFYDLYSVQCSLDYDFPDDNRTITLSGTINRYKNDISFIDNSCYTVSNT